MHVVEVELDLLGRVLCTAGEVYCGTILAGASSRSCCRLEDPLTVCVGHLRSFLFQIICRNRPLAGILEHLLLRADQNAVPDLVAVGPVSCTAQLFVGTDFVQKSDEALPILAGGGSFLGLEEERVDPRVMYSCFCQGLGDNGGLLEFDAEAQVDDRVQEAWG